MARCERTCLLRLTQALQSRPSAGVAKRVEIIARALCRSAGLDPDELLVVDAAENFCAVSRDLSEVDRRRQPLPGSKKSVPGCQPGFRKGPVFFSWRNTSAAETVQPYSGPSGSGPSQCTNVIGSPPAGKPTRSRFSIQLQQFTACSREFRAGSRRNAAVIGQ